MTLRNLNPYTLFDQQALHHKPTMAFTGKTKADFDAWAAALRPKLLATLGSAPKRVDTNAKLIYQWEDEGLIKQRWVIDVQPGFSATLLVFRPANLKAGEKRPAIMCCHGHQGSKEHVMGVINSDEMRNWVRTCNYDYGLQMAKRGFVTYAIDWLGFGERDAKAKPHNSKALGDQSPCNTYYLCATMLGTTPLMMNLCDAMRATDVVSQLPFVDADRLGVMGLSLGGTMTTWSALLDPRFKAADISCYAGPFHEIAYRTYNVCGLQVTPGLLELADVADIQGLIAPKPLLIEVGLMDSCFEADYTLENLHAVEKIYAAAGASDKLEADVFPGVHRWADGKCQAFFRKNLSADWS